MKSILSVKTFCFFLAIFSSSVLTSTAYAFKIDTHVWIGQQVINDLQDGYLTFKTKDKRSIKVYVNSGVRQSILNNQNAFRMGNIGPDAVPDMIVGQNVVHPGEGTWATDDWLHHVLQQAEWDDNEESLAFAYGYLGHAAGDTFAHTYVNWYSGDVFSLFDGETEVELRHAAIEGYIGKHTPPLKNYAGRLIGQLYDLVSSPSRFIRDSLIFNDEVNEQYLLNPAAIHMATFYDIRKRLLLEIDGEIVNAIGEKIQQLFGEAGISTSRDPSGNVNLKYNNRSALKNYGGKSYNTKTLKDIKDNFYELKSISNVESVRKAYADLKDLITNRMKIDMNKRKGINDKLLALKLKIDKFETFKENGNLMSTKSFSNLWDDITDLFGKVVDEIEEFFSDLNRNVRGILSGIEDFVKNPSEFYFRKWLDALDLSTKEYVNSAAKSIVNTVNPSKSSLQPMKDWYVCYAPMVYGVPKEINKPMCQAHEVFMNVTEAFSDAADKLSQIVGLDKLFDKLKEKIIDELYRAAIKGLKHVDPTGRSGTYIEFMRYLHRPEGTDAELNSIFSSDSSGKRLLIINDIAERMKAEMAVENGYFNPEKFLVIKNAVQLAKLSILNQSELDNLASQLNVSSTKYGDTLFGNVPWVSSYSILFGSIRNIDGNHLWMPYAPEYPRLTDGDGYTKIDRQFGYGYTHDNQQGYGFRPWIDTKSRNKMFNQLFVGPISPGVDAPEVIGFPAVKPSHHSYDVCEANPFPIDENDKLCTFIKVLPVIILLN